MPTVPILAALLAASLLATEAAQASVVVNFAGGRYADAKGPGPSARKAVRAHLLQLGTRYTSPGERLTITVLDIDRAGFDMSEFGPSRPRVLNQVTPPRIKLRYRLERNGRTIASGEDTIVDRDYLSRPGSGFGSGEFKYEQRMLDDWFFRTFSAGRSRAR